MKSNTHQMAELGIKVKITSSDDELFPDAGGVPLHSNEPNKHTRQLNIQDIGMSDSSLEDGELLDDYNNDVIGSKRNKNINPQTVYWKEARKMKTYKCGISYVSIRDDLHYDVYIGDMTKSLPASIWKIPHYLNTSKSKEKLHKDYEEYIRRKEELFSLLPTLKNKILGCRYVFHLFYTLLFYTNIFF